MTRKLNKYEYNFDAIGLYEVTRTVVKTQRRILWGLFWITIKKETK
jgi:hypothetical protein